MEDLLNRYEKHYGYKATISELYELYTQGELQLNADDENTLLKAITNSKGFSHENIERRTS